LGIKAKWEYFRVLYERIGKLFTIAGGGGLFVRI